LTWKGFKKKRTCWARIIGRRGDLSIEIRKNGRVRDQTWFLERNSFFTSVGFISAKNKTCSRYFDCQIE